MKKIQQNIIKVMEACFVQLRNELSIDLTSITVENGIFINFKSIFRREFGHDWSHLKPKLRQLLNDVTTEILFLYKSDLTSEMLASRHAPIGNFQL